MVMERAQRAPSPELHEQRSITIALSRARSLSALRSPSYHHQVMVMELAALAPSPELFFSTHHNAYHSYHSAVAGFGRSCVFLCSSEWLYHSISVLARRARSASPVIDEELHHQPSLNT